MPSPEEAPPPSLTRSALLAEDEVPAADTEQPEGSIEATQAALDRSLHWRARVLLEQSASAAQLSDGPAVVDALEHNNQGVIRQIPFAAQRALAVSRNPNSSVGELVALFERDPTLTQSLLKVANSSWYGRGDDAIVSIAAAVQRIGYQGVENVLLASIVEGVLCRPGGAYQILAGKVWSHMLRTAPLARRLAPAFGIDPEKAYTLALLHDVGKLVVFDFISARRRELHREVKVPETFLCSMLNHLHEPVGGHAALRWGLGAEAARALAEHHRHPVPTTPDLLTELLFVAERIDLVTAVRYDRLNWAVIWDEGAITTDRGAVEERFAAAGE